MSTDNMTPEEIRVEMKRRFDAANAEAKDRRDVRNAADETRRAERNNRGSNTTPAKSSDTPEIGENDSSGG